MHATLGSSVSTISGALKTEAIGARVRPFVVARPWRARLLVILTLALTVGISQSDSLLFGIVPYERDTPAFYYPLTVWIADQLHHGVFPLWAPPIFGGYPIFADGELGLAYPPMLLALWLLPADRAFVLMRAFHLLVAALGAYALARAWRLPRPSATLAGITFAFGSFFQAQIHHENIVRTASWLPFALTCAELALRARGRRRMSWTAAGALVVGLASLGLHSQLLAIDLMALAGYGLIRWWAGPIRGAGVRLWPRFRGLAVVFPAVASLGVALGAVQILPLGELATFSPRGSGLPYDQAAAYSETPYGLIQLVFPYFFRAPGNHQWGLWTHWESYLYVGLVPLVLALAALALVRRRDVLGWATIGLVFLVISLGQYSPVNLHYLLAQLPGFNGLRAPGRFSVVVVLALAMLASHGLTWFTRHAGQTNRSTRTRRFFRALAALQVALTLGLLGIRATMLFAPTLAEWLAQNAYLALPRDTYPLSARDVLTGLAWDTNPRNPWLVGGLAGLVAIAAALYLWHSARWPSLRQWNGWPALLVVATAGDLLVFGWFIHPREPLARISAPPPAAQAVQARLAHDSGGPYRVLASTAIDQISPDHLAVLGLQEANGYTSLESRWHSELMQRVLRVDDSLLDLWNVRYLIEPAQFGRLASYRGVDYLPGQALLSAPARSALGDQEFRVTANALVAQLDLVTALVGAADVPQDTVVGEVVLHAADGSALARLPLRAGRETMDWGWNLPTVRPTVAHDHVEEAGTVGETGASGRSSPRWLSYAQLPLAQPLAPATVEIRSVSPKGELVVYGGALVSPDGTRQQLFGFHKTKYQEVYHDDQLVVLQNRDVFPRAFVVPRARMAPTTGASLQVMETQPFQPRQEVVIAADTPPPPTATDPFVGSSAGSRQHDGETVIPSPPKAAITSYGLDDVRIQVSTPTDGYLVLTDTFYPGWTATVDGRPETVLRGDMLFRTLPVPAGDHTVEFRFEPRSVEIGLAITLGALALTLGMLAAGLRSRRAHR